MNRPKTNEPPVVGKLFILIVVMMVIPMLMDFCGVLDAR